MKLIHISGILLICFIVVGSSSSSSPLDLDKGNVTVVVADSNLTDSIPSVSTTAPKKVQPKTTVVYSFSNVSTTEEGTQMSQLTIATGSDGKYHYIRNENGNKTEGIWEGVLPKSPDVENMMSEFTKETINPNLVSLSSQIHSSIEDYLKNALLK